MHTACPIISLRSRRSVYTENAFLAERAYSSGRSASGALQKLKKALNRFITE